MSFWSKNPELLDEITTKFLPEEWKTKVETGEIGLNDVPTEIHDKAMDEGVRDYWGGLADDAKMRHKERMPDGSVLQHDEGRLK